MEQTDTESLGLQSPFVRAFLKTFAPSYIDFFSKKEAVGEFTDTTQSSIKEKNDRYNLLRFSNLMAVAHELETVPLSDTDVTEISKRLASSTVGSTPMAEFLDHSSDDLSATFAGMLHGTIDGHDDGFTINDRMPHTWASLYNSMYLKERNAACSPQEKAVAHNTRLIIMDYFANPPREQLKSGEDSVRLAVNTMMNALQTIKSKGKGAAAAATSVFRETQIELAIKRAQSNDIASTYNDVVSGLTGICNAVFHAKSNAEWRRGIPEGMEFPPSVLVPTMLPNMDQSIWLASLILQAKPFHADQFENDLKVLTPATTALGLVSCAAAVGKDYESAQLTANGKWYLTQGKEPEQPAAIARVKTVLEALNRNIGTDVKPRGAIPPRAPNRP